ncbi:hypothetical protein [Halorubrum sp. 48-1-W]|uniref:hypothetical protein n=1 Tax=Halorubrum sp. 48-1-W TaxID=2249761 RepID=UPI000FCCB112|nr:hypothetical protein [Halorubrum sp. 48-1-W]
MARIFIAVVVAVLLFGGGLAADQMLQNPELEPADADTATQQQDFAESTTPMLRAGAPAALFALVVGAVLVAVRAVGG